ncbi:MAG: thiolase family protein [Methanomassiliicoccales archaeon]|nr:MAG: thiolase family protein [Methanomassiliicoccales archaeon]
MKRSYPSASAIIINTRLWIWGRGVYMTFKDSYIPYGGYWSTPFCRWQGSFANQHAIKFGAEIAARALTERNIKPTEFDGIILGMTIPQTSCFYGAPWMAGMTGADHITGPIVSQACATSANSVGLAALGIETGINRAVLVVTCDRTSNGPHLVYPNPLAPGARPDSEDWVWDNFGFDPFAKNAMIETAENVAKESGITKEEQDEVTFMRYSQYQDSVKEDGRFQKRYMVSPIEIMDAKKRKVLATVQGDEGVFPTTMEGLSKLRPVLPNGTVTFGTQTYPADGNAGIIVTTRDNAKRLSAVDDIEIKIVSYGDGRAKKGFMAQAIVPAAKKALKRADITLDDIKAIKTHNPFAVNDIYFANEMGMDVKDMNNFGCSLIYGHPQGPTGSRLIIELIEELVLSGGGFGLFDGCAAGDTAAAIVFEVTLD